MDTQATSKLPGFVNSPWLPMLITAAAYLLFFLARGQLRGWDPSIYINAGGFFCNPRETPRELKVAPAAPGFDGQFYCRLAMNPFTRDRVSHGMRLDNPPYRYQRIIYPLLVWAVSLGNPGRVPMNLILVNYIGLCVIAWVSARIAQSLGRHTLGGLAIPFFPGFLLSFARDLTEITQMVFFLGALLLLRRERAIGATLLMVVAVLSKELSIIVPAAALVLCLLAALKGGEARPVRWYFAVIPLLACLAWQAFLLAWMGRVSFGSNALSGAFGMPFRAAVECFIMFSGLSTSEHVFFFLEISLLLAMLVAVACALPSSSAMPVEKVAWVLYAVMGTLLNQNLWCEDWSLLRAFTPFYVLGCIILIGSRIANRGAIFVGGGLVWLGLFLARR